MTGTGTLLRLALRLDRVRLSVWVFVLAVMPAATAAQYQTIYPNDQAIRDVSGFVSNPSLVALNGPLFSATLGGLTAWKIGATEFILVALMSLLTVVRHTRAEEEAGRLELVGSGSVGRYAPLTAALALAGLANLAVSVLTTVFLLGTGLAAAGSVAFGLAVGVTGLVFAALAAVAAQLAEGGRTASGIAVAALGGAYLLRAAGDTGPTWLSWLSPLGWGIEMRAYAGERWWVAGLALALVAVLLCGAYALVARRDLGAGVLSQRPGAPAAGAALGGPLGLAWRLQRGVLVSWVVGMAVAGAVLGGSADGLSANSLDSNQKVSDLLARLGGHQGITDAYLAAVFGITGLVVGGYAVQATLRLRAEESSGRVEPLLAAPVGRVRWVLSHLVIALAGTAGLLAVAGLSGGLVYGLEIHDVGGQVPRLLGAALAQLPATWVLAGLGVALFGLVPRLAALGWAALVACFLLLELGALLDLSQPVLDVSPFAHVPKLPGGALTGAPLLWLTAVAAALAAAGVAAFRHRDAG